MLALLGTRVPPVIAVAVQLADEGCLVADEAREFLKGFNRQMLAQARPLWAVALPVSRAVPGRCVQPGERIEGARSLRKA